MSDRERSRSPDGGDGGHQHQDHEQHNGGDDNNGSNGDDGGAPIDGVKLYVGNLDYATDEEKLRTEFAQFGTVTDVFLPVEKGTQRPRGFGFVTLADRSAAENAISKMDQSQLDGRTIRVNESRPKGVGAPRGPGGVGGFNSAGKEEVSDMEDALSLSLVFGPALKF
jgi:cold-inducible RNA-binding protein